MTVKKLLIIGSISLVAVATVIVVPIAVSKAIKNKKQHEEPETRQITEDDIIDDDHIGPVMQTELNNSYDLYHQAASSNDQIVSKLKDYVYLCKTSGLHYSTDNSSIYYWSLNSGVWDIYSSEKISLSPVVQPEQQFGGYYVYYQTTV